MDKRFTLFMVVSVAIVIVTQLIYARFFPPPPKPVDPAAKQEQLADDKPAAEPRQPAREDEVPAEPREPGVIAAVVDAPPQWVTIGSADPASPYRMVVIATNRGAAIERLELNSPRYRELDDRSGFMGYLVPDDAPDESGAIVRVVAPGCPADRAGLKANDIIKQVGDTAISSARDLVATMRATKPNEQVTISVDRSGARLQLPVDLERAPLAVLRPEWETKVVDLPDQQQHDPFSFLATIQQFDDRTLDNADGELGGVDLKTGNWEIVATKEDSVTFRRVVPRLGLEVVKTFTLDQVPQDSLGDPDYPAYSLKLAISVKNVGDRAHKVAYRLDGPTGLPIEGAWYATKLSRTWSGAGLRDVLVQFERSNIEQISPAQMSAPDFERHWSIKHPLDFIAVDAQYFASAVIPIKESADEVHFAEIRPMRVGTSPRDEAGKPIPSKVNLTNVSFRLDSLPVELLPGGAPLEHQFTVFAGPKRPQLLAEYGTNGSLGQLLYYGWFWWVAQPMRGVLHVFYNLVGNYGLAIIMLTLVVRSGMIPLGRNQAKSMQKMQELQPEMKRIAEKFKNDPAKRTQAQQELFRTHNYNPFGGCLLVFIQLPIFGGLWRALQVDVELRDAPLFSENIRWASNLAAPDMFWNWSSLMPDFVTSGTGILGLGPYLNLFPLIAIGLILMSQKLTMPPPTDEQSAMQQKMMQYMMVFFGLLFFKWPSGLNLYTITSTLWGIGERKLLPKPGAKGANGVTTPPPSSGGGSGNGSAQSKKRQRGRR